MNTDYSYERIGDMFNPAIKPTPLETARLWFGRQLANLRLWMRKHGLPVAPSQHVGAIADDIEAPGKEWVWHRTQDVAGLVAEILDWIDEIVLRAPVIGGIDKQLLGIGIYKLDRKQVAWESVVMDKYGWRKRGRDDICEWLTKKLAESGEPALAVTAQRLAFANIMSAQRRANSRR